MKILLTIFFSTFLVLPCFSQQDLLPVYPKEISYQGDRAYFQGAPFTGLLVEEKTNKQLGEFKSGYKNGLFIEYYTNGKAKNQGRYILGKKEGPHTIWYENGSKKDENNYVNGELNGTFTEWHSNGQIRFEYSFSSGEITDGQYSIYLENGQKDKEETYTRGVKSKERMYKDGDIYELSVEYYTVGRKKAEGVLKNGLRDGIWTEWYKTGEKKREGKYENGNLTSLIYEDISLLTDIDDNVYHSVTIRTLVWMTENLKTTKFNDGTAIPQVTDNFLWASLTTPGYCWYYNDEATYKDTFGALYNLYAVNSGKLCPIGWHVASDNEWTILTINLGGPSVAGGALKEIGTTYWNNPNTGARNSNGFKAVPGGGRSNTGVFNYMGIIGYWWSSSISDSNIIRSINYNSSSIYRDNSNNKFGFSVRCVKDF